MRTQIQFFMQEHPLPPVVSPYHRFFAPFARPAFLSALLMFAVVGGGTAFASEGALPGDALYGVKVSVVEPIQGALAVSSTAKAKWSVHITDKRLNEAQKLSREKKLSASTQRALAKRFSVAASNAARQVNELASSMPESAVAVAIDLDTTLTSHRAAIQALADGGVGEPGPVLAALVEEVEVASSMAAETLAEGMPPSVAVDTSLEVAEGVARIQLFAAHKSNDDAKDALKVARSIHNATTTEAASASIDRVDAKIEKGKQQFKRKEYADAAELFARARSIARDSEHLLEETSRHKMHVPSLEQESSSVESHETDDDSKHSD